MPRTNAISAKEFVNFSSPSKSTKIMLVRHMADAGKQKKEKSSFSLWRGSRAGEKTRLFIFRTCKLDCRKLTDANAERQANEDDLKIVLRKWNENNADACHKQGIIVQTHNGHSIQNWNIAKGALL